MFWESILNFLSEQDVFYARIMQPEEDSEKLRYISPSSSEPPARTFALSSTADATTTTKTSPTRGMALRCPHGCCDTLPAAPWHCSEGHIRHLNLHMPGNSSSRGWE